MNTNSLIPSTQELFKVNERINYVNKLLLTSFIVNSIYIARFQICLKEKLDSFK